MENKTTKATIDIGSNSILCFAAQGSLENEVLDKSYITKLGEKIDETGVFSQEALERSLKALKEIKDLLSEVDEIIITATEASRVAKNGNLFLKEVSALFAKPVFLLSPEGEAYYSALGVSHQLKQGGTVLDIGGASTELINLKLEPFSIEKSISLPIGSVRMTDWMKNDESEFKVSEIKNQIKNFTCLPYFVGIAGTVVALAHIALKKKSFSPQCLDSFSFDKKVMDELALFFSNHSLDDIRQKFLFLEKRVETLQGGFEVLKFFFEFNSEREIFTSCLGLRHGIWKANSLNYLVKVIQ